jgi:chromosome segregation ATPase
MASTDCNSNQAELNKQSIKQLDKRMNKNEEKIEDIQGKVPVLEHIMKDMVETNKEQNKVMAKLGETISHININISKINTKMESFADGLKNTDEKHKELSVEVDKIKDAQNFNIMRFIKENVVGATIMFSLGGGALFTLFKIIEFFQDK